MKYRFLKQEIVDGNSVDLRCYSSRQKEHHVLYYSRPDIDPRFIDSKELIYISYVVNVKCFSTQGIKFFSKNIIDKYYKGDYNNEYITLYIIDYTKNRKLNIIAGVAHQSHDQEQEDYTFIRGKFHVNEFRFPTLFRYESYYELEE